MARRPLTAAEETAQRISEERSSPFRRTHVYEPTGWDRFDPRGVQGEPIEPGTDVQLMREHTRQLHQGMPGRAKQMFNVVRDAQGNMQHVSKASLGARTRLSKEDMSRGMAVSDIFHDRRQTGEPPRSPSRHIDAVMNLEP